MKPSLCVLILALGLPTMAWSQVYRCDSGGETRFSDQPCGQNSQKIIIRDNTIGGNFGQNLPPEQKTEEAHREQDEPGRQQAEDTCRFINSTDLRRYLVREQVVQGMTREHVRKAGLVFSR